MAINNKPLGTPVGVDTSPGEAVSPKLVNTNTSEEDFQEGLYDVAIQVDRNQMDIGYDNDPMTRSLKQARTVDDRLDTVEGVLGISNDDQGTQTASDAGLAVGGVSGPLSGTLASPVINDDAIGSQHLAMNAVDANALADDIDFDITLGGTATSNTIDANTGQDFTIPYFSETVNGLVEGPTAGEASRPTTDTSPALYVLGSDNNWHQLNEFARQGAQVPASSVTSAFTTHRVQAAVPANTTGESYLAIAANRMEPTGTGGALEQFGLERGDIIVLTNTTPNPDQVIAYTYVGPSVAASADANEDNFIALGVASVYGVESDGGLDLNNNQFRLSSTIPGDRSFSGNLAATANATFGNDASTDTVNFASSRANSNFVPSVDEMYSLGSSALRWNANLHDVNFDGTLTGTVPRNQIEHASAMADQVLTISNGDPEWVDPPIGIQMVTTLTIGATGSGVVAPENVAVGSVVSLTAVDGNNEVGVYRAVTTTGTPATSATWQRLGTVNVIMSKTRLTSVANQAGYNVGGNIPAAHLITIDGLTLVESIDYTIDSNRQGFTLTAAVTAGKDIELIRFSDIATVGTGEVSTSSLAPGVLPSGITIPGSQVNGTVPLATAGNNNSFTIGNWVIAEDGNGRLTFSNNGDVRARLDTDGHFHTENDITAFDSL